MAVSRAEAIATLEDGHGRVRDLLAGRPERKLTRAGTIGGGDWSAKDLIAHLCWWEEIALRSLEEWRAGGRPWIEEVFVGGAEGIDRINAEDMERKTALSLQQVRSLAEDVHRRLVTAIRDTGDEQWTAKARYEAPRRDRLGELLGSVLGAPKRPFGHAFAHLPDLQAFVASLA